MFNPPDSQQNPGSYVNLAQRMTTRVQQQNVDDQILKIVKQIFGEELDKENIALEPTEKARLLRHVTKKILTELLESIDSKK